MKLNVGLLSNDSNVNWFKNNLLSHTTPLLCYHPGGWLVGWLVTYFFEKSLEMREREKRNCVVWCCHLMVWHTPSGKWLSDSLETTHSLSAKSCSTVRPTDRLFVRSLVGRLYYSLNAVSKRQFATWEEEGKEGRKDKQLPRDRDHATDRTTDPPSSHSKSKQN